MHKGHESLLTGTFSKSEKVTIGITSNEFASQRLKNNFEDYELRLRQLEEFLKRNNFFERATIIKLEDVFGTTLTDATVDSIIVTKETIEGATAINDARAKSGLGKLKVHLVPLVLGHRRKAITSTNIREGITNRLGEDYFSKIGRVKYILPDEFRPLISVPQGKIIREKDLGLFDFSKQTKIILVGDIVTKTFIKYGYKFDLSVVDLKTRKKKLFKSLSDLGVIKVSNLATVRNKRGTISSSIVKAVREVFVKNLNDAVIKVIGEEDLAVIPIVILAPLSSLVFYGQRDEGIVCVEVTERAKEKFIKILEYFKKD